MRVLLTQPAPRVEAVARRLAARGHEVLGLPVSRVDSLLSAEPVAALRGMVARAACVVLVSPSAVEVLLERGLSADEWPSGVEVAVMGPGSVESLAEHGIDSAVTTVYRPAGPPFDSAALLALERFATPGPAPAAARLLVVRGEEGRVDWIDVLRERGFDVQVLVAYRTRPIPPQVVVLQSLQEWLRSRLPVVSVFTSAEAVARLSAPLLRLDGASWLQDRPVLTIHPRIARTLSEHGWRDVRVIEPGETRLAGAIESLE